MNDIEEVVAIWESYFETIDNWRHLIGGAEPKIVGCGSVYELTNPIDRPNESFAIADMRNLDLAEPHKHINGETEIYIVLEGTGIIAVGDKILDLRPGVTIVTPPDTVHITKPVKGLVLAVVNTPPFAIDNYVVVDESAVVIMGMISKLQA